MDGSVQFKMYERKPVVEYSATGCQSLLHRGFMFVFKFVKDNGTHADLVEVLK